MGDDRRKTQLTEGLVGRKMEDQRTKMETRKGRGLGTPWPMSVGLTHL